MKRHAFLKLAALVALAGIGGPVLANPCPPGLPPTNCPPPAGTDVFDLAGAPIPHSQTEYSATFVATLASNYITFAFREDPAFWHLSDVTLTQMGSATNLLSNGDFSTGTVGTTTVADWTYSNSYGVSEATGVLSSGCGNGGGNCWNDGSVQGYDSISQPAALAVGDTYTLSFWLTDTSGLTTASQLSNNGDTSDTGGNGVDVLVYAGAMPVETGTPPPPVGSVPEPGTIALLGLGLAALGLARLRRQKA